MKTDDLIIMLAAGITPIAPQSARRRFMSAMGLGVFFALLLMLATLGMNPGPSASLPMFWVKLAFTVAIAATSLIAAFRLARPGVRLGMVLVAMAMPVVAMWGFAVVEVIRAPATGRLTLLLGQTWVLCPFLIAMLSVPVFIAVFWAMKGLAPTQPTLAGAMSGLLAGAVGAAVYCLHCHEMAAPFLAVWYSLGMLIPAVIGAIAGRRLLRW
ncbi:MAG: DUF1109 domain-containing protein [Betaproteobacteria bacterium]|nr:DUF1109 domain-containing protein [Betaproteobacteria bacterium]